ncbi:MAG: DUF2085 domain-containing protein [Anaerolineae bacterium]|nr:DUF2085 domain-containing protein [Anaerolineae bacterium]
MTEINSKKRALRANLLLLAISRRWLGIAITVISIYVTLPFVAPVLMHAGLRGPGGLIYTLYSPFCHQFAFRSFFLFGEQPTYPREITEIGAIPFEDAAIQSPEFVEVYARYAGIAPSAVTRADFDYFSPALQFASREFPGDNRMGYKVTLCERDISIYLAMLLGAILFRLVRRRLRPVPLLIYAILGLGPIGIDGFSQLLGYPPFNLWPARETLPAFRVVTGFLFGLMNVWLGFPYLEISFRETQEQIEDKLRRAGIHAGSGHN